MEKIATDTYSFERIRQNGFVYVDKTAILKLLADGSLGSQFFVARPRRFGKSLAISTLQCLFEGRRDLFKGLAIEPDWDWSKTYPVLKLDMGSCQASSVDELWRFFANIPANITVKREKYYQTLFYAVFVLIGARTFAECWTNRGRVDAVVETPCGIYVFEFKLNGAAEAALAQIKEKGYHEKYLRRGKKVTLVGAAFDAEMRNLSDRRIEVVA